MSKFLDSSLISSYWAKVGQCTKCMRQSAVVCFGAWLATSFVSCFGPVEVAYSIGAFAMAATALSVVHIGTYAQREFATAERTMEAKLNRRLAFRTLLVGAGAALAVMVTNRPALAASRCGGWNGECSNCEKNFRLDEAPSGCHRCSSCTRTGRDCGLERC
jgi:hypothetical protein